MRLQPSNFIRTYQILNSTGSFDLATRVFKQGVSKQVLNFLSMGGKFHQEGGQWVAEFGR
jgi:hypothetical protein